MCKPKGERGVARPALQGQAQVCVGRGACAAGGGAVVVVLLHGRAAAKLEEGTAQGPRGRRRRPWSRDPPCE